MSVTRREFVAASVAAMPWWYRVLPAGDLLELGAESVVHQIRNGALRAESYAMALLRQYEKHRHLNVANALDPDRVLQAAREVDRSRSRGSTLGPAAGLPFGVKDQIEVAGYPATAGNRALRGYRPSRSAVVVERLVSAGAIPFCMTSLPDMAVPDGLMHQASSYSDGFGVARNPYDSTRIPGGSSGGSGAALAARIVPAALGLDTNGSIRCPAAFCGVAGLRPSTWTMENALRGMRRKRYPDEGVLLPPVGRLDTIGPMARTVSDVAFLDALITGERAPRVDLRRVRIGVPGADFWEQEPVEPGVAAVVKEAFEKLQRAGCVLVEIDFNAEVRAIFGSLEAPSMASILAAEGLGALHQSPDTMMDWLRDHAPGVTLEQMYRGRPVRAGRRTLPPETEQRSILEQAVSRYAGVFRLHGLDAIGFPTVPMVASPIRAGGPKEPLGDLLTVNGIPIEEGKVLARNLFLAPRLGAAALSIPAGLSDGLPVGLELDALPGRDRDLLGIGVAVQDAIGRLPRPSAV